jgi:hypothetical protein
LATQERINVGSQWALLPDGRSHSYVGLARRYESGSDWAWGLAYQSAGQGDRLERRRSNTPEPDGYFREGASQFNLGGAAWLLDKRIAVGVDAKLYSQGLGDATATGYSGDLGLLWRSSPWMDLAFSLRDVYGYLTWSTSHVDALAQQARAAWALHPWGEAFWMALEAERSSGQDTRLHLGAELWAWPRHLAFRAGWDDGLLATGLGARADIYGMQAGLDYSLAGDRASTELQQRFSLHLGFDL